ncbi:RNA polymerase sigma factor [Nitrobacter winogradskyi]|uniref:RNA polymerase sigma-70 factor (ECF subfamily) n=2 Tax=Nitrobacter winogradskyi TaxID=913 RepID=A0ACC6AKU9_NITWI|nr:sigma-70 family RNA polymerase sigma factor [Nitrobacter winogradskyi]MCP2000118.1 RNA polymerase sigma-70 factor (ECF subfamily) [Nitrobacter winogradskyi]GEC15756.1 RNA polymerase sigma factor [Nitrobacter winogradskyi]
MTEAIIHPIGQLIESHYFELRSFARRKLRNATLAEDVVQEACLRVASARNEEIANPRAFLYRVVSNLVIDHQRKAQRHELVAEWSVDEVEIIDESADAERQLVARQRLALLSKAIAELPPRCRECFVLRRFDGLDYDEIARHMGISRNMVSKHLRLAIAHCARRVREGD